jgi:hypothetical protein
VRLYRRVLLVLLVASQAMVPFALGGSGASADGVNLAAGGRWKGLWKGEGNQGWARFGYSAGLAGDVNGDGYDDLIVGAYSFDNGSLNAGAAFVFHGSATGLSATPDWTVEFPQFEAFFGRSVGTAGDVNGDGYDDVIVGAYGYGDGQTNEGAAFVYHGSATGLSTTPAWTAESNRYWALFGNSVATAGDVNGDGYADVIVGAPQFRRRQEDEGRAFVYHGSATGLSTTPDWTAEPNQAFAQFGYSVRSAGDVNGDSYDDVIVGAPFYDNGQDNEGGAFVFHGSAAGLSATPDWANEPDQVNANFGRSVGTAGDVNGDGYADAIVGAYGYDNGQTDEGVAFAYHGSTGGLSATPDWTAESDQASANFGVSVGTAGDVNGDGYADAIVGAYFYDHGETNEGAAFLYLGTIAGLSDSRTRCPESDQSDAQFGTSVGAAGDMNGDGYADVFGGAPFFDSRQGNEGVVFVWPGRG